MENLTNYFKNLRENVQLAIAEDLGTGDITAQLIPESQEVSAFAITREKAIVCGRPWFDEVVKQIDESIDIHWLVNEGGEVSEDQTLVEINGNARAILTAERTALNFLQTLMATATTARNYTAIVKASKIQILDTRKTIPGLRLAQKYAVTISDCKNHRIGLFDAFLIKENHIAACGGIAEAVVKARALKPEAIVEVEAETLDEVKEAIEAGADRIMLDNFSQEQIKNAIDIKTDLITYEISGNITSDSLNKTLQKGIDFISSGALTKNVDPIDLSMRLHK